MLLMLFSNNTGLTLKGQRELVKKEDKTCVIPLNIRCLEESNPQRQTAEWWPPGAGGPGWGVTVEAVELQFGETEKLWRQACLMQTDQSILRAVCLVTDLAGRDVDPWRWGKRPQRLQLASTCVF